MLNGHATYDQDYRPTNRTVSGVFNHTYATDDEGNITQKGAWAYAYDELNRLDEQDDSSTTTAFTYDAIDNRLTENDGSTTTYTYPSTSSKLSSVGSDSYTYDAMGNITDDDALAYTWSAAALLKEVKISGTSTVLGTYTYSYNNQRSKKVAGGNTVHYVYGQGGLLYGEYDNSGNLIREYVYLNDEPLAQVDAGTSEVLTYLHTDHLATPRYGTNAAGSTVWTWDSGAFGKEPATGTATVNLRFPGQYFDSETGLHYNWNRYYNPAIGRYVSSDPIGLAGGLSTFGYAGQTPLGSIDPMGLTEKQVWAMIFLATELETDLGITTLWIWWPYYIDVFGDNVRGLNPTENPPIWIATYYKKDLDCYELWQLYKTIVHEHLHMHWNWGIAGIRGRPHSDYHEEARRRANKAKSRIIELCGTCPLNYLDDWW